MFTLMAGLLILAASILVYVGYPIFLNWIFRSLLKPLQVPSAFPLEARRERLMTFFVFLTFTISYLALIIMLFVYVIALRRHLRERRAVAAGAPPPKVPRIPRIPLNELLLMVFSLALFPVLVGAASEYVFSTLTSDENFTEHWQEIKTIVMASSFAVAAILFPMCFASAYHRLDSNDIPLSRLRMAFLFLYPYVLIALPVTIAGLIAGIFVGIITAGESPASSAARDILVLGGGIWLAAVILLITGRAMASRLTNPRSHSL